MEWGTVGYEAHELDRADFQYSDRIVSYIDGSKNQRYFNPKLRSRYAYESAVVVFILTACAVGVVASIYVIRAYLALSISDDYAQIIVSIINAIQIYVFNYLYGKIAEALTLRENHRTDTEYEDSLIAKFFSFQVFFFFFKNIIFSFYFIYFLNLFPHVFFLSLFSLSIATPRFFI
jgi:uncharacterized membrane protein